MPTQKLYPHFIILLMMALCFTTVSSAAAHHLIAAEASDRDKDGLSDDAEVRHGTDSGNSDTDGDGYLDGDEVSHGYDPLLVGGARLKKSIVIDLSEQRLRYAFGELGEQGSLLISSASKGFRTPIGTFAVQMKKPLVNYRGRDYNYPKTKWNLQFLPSYYIHGTWWHNNFGSPMSHGCVNVSYPDMEKLYAFADEGTQVIIQQ